MLHGFETSGYVILHTEQCNIPDKQDPMHGFANVHSKPISNKNMGLQGYNLSLCQ